MPMLFEVHIPGPTGRPPKSAPIHVSPPVFTPGQGTGSQGANNPYQGSNFKLVNTTRQTRALALVYATGANSVAVASANSPNPVVGLLIVKQGDTQGILQVYGPVSALKGLQPGVRYFLGDNGDVVAAPFAAGDIRFVQQIGYGLDDGTLFLQPTGTVIARDTTDGSSSAPAQPNEAAYVGDGPPSASQDYPNQSVYIDRQTGIWYNQKSDPNQPSRFYVGDGSPSDSVTYEPMAVSVDNSTGAYYVESASEDATQSTLVPFSVSLGAPTSPNVGAYRTVYFNKQTADAYHGDS